MGKINISKDDFVKAINDVKETSLYVDKLNDFFRDYGAEGYIFPPSCVDTTLHLLELLMNDSDDWIGYFCLELDFGQRYHDGCIKDGNGNNIVLTGPEELYDYLAAD